ncbi:hypothetical protein [Methylobacter sp.]|uniref:hypothetical protein n=1 Tax=Methylobacter sp. TaxID=2051955 RepID=UPI002FDD5EFF
MSQLMNPNHNITTGTDIIRQTVFEMGRSFTISEVVETIQTNHRQAVDAMLVNAYLDQISRAGIVEQHGRKYWKNIPDF